MIAIQGHPTRGKEVMQILENLGGINRMNHTGRYDKYFYYISEDDNVVTWTCIRSDFFKVYTLEEFEKEFPFKIGDRVISITTSFIGTITKLSENGWYYVKYDNGNFACAFGQNLKPYKEMKEERNITLTLDKAKEWYKKGGELKEIALQAFTEQELNPLPRSWEEFCKNHPVKDKEAHFDSVSNIIIQKDDATLRASTRDRNVCPSRKSAEAHLAMIQLEQLRNCWWNGWEPIWDASNKYAIKNLMGEITIIGCSNVAAFLVFPTREMAEEFLKCFNGLIELARDLI